MSDFFCEGSSESSEYLIERSENSKQCSLEFRKCDELQADPGDLIEFRRFCGLYGHWGVLVTNREVIHLSFSKEEGLEIRIDKLKAVAHNGFCRVNNFENHPIRNRPNIKINNKNQVMANAFKYLNQFEKGILDYSITKLNCEHFATLCLFDEIFSEQADNIKDKPELLFYSKFIDKSVAIIDNKA